MVSSPILWKPIQDKITLNLCKLLLIMFMQVYHVKEMEQKIEMYSMERLGTLGTTMLNPWLMLKREDVIVQGISTMK